MDIGRRSNVSDEPDFRIIAQDFVEARQKMLSVWRHMVEGMSEQHVGVLLIEADDTASAMRQIVLSQARTKLSDE